jgi:hypothetical protein
MQIRDSTTRHWHGRRWAVAIGLATAAGGGFLLLDQYLIKERFEARGARTRLTADGDVYGVALDSPRFTDRDVAEACGTPTLQSLSVARANITDASLASIARVAQLRELDLSETVVTDGGLAQLQGLKRLEYLRVAQCRNITFESVRGLSTLPRLVFLDVSGTRISIAEYQELRVRMPNANLLIDPVHALGLPKGSLEVSAYVAPDGIGVSFHDVDLAQLQRLAEPQTVAKLTCHSLNDDVHVAWKAFNGLRTLEVAKGGTDADLDALQSCGGLHTLRLYDSEVSDAGVTAISNSQHLEVLHLVSRHISGRSLAALSRLDRLTDLLLIVSEITPDEVRFLRSLPRLKLLVLRDCGLTDEVLVQCGPLPQVSFLSLSGNPLSDECIDQLQLWPALRDVELANTNVSPEAFRRLQDHLGSVRRSHPDSIP